MLTENIPFEIHITTNDLSTNRQEEFIHFCNSIEAKPIMIELLKGDFVKQPMFSKIIASNSIPDVLSISKGIIKKMDQQNFLAKRLKIEVPSEKSVLFKNYNTDFEKYFEWHCKINYKQKDKLLSLCSKHKAHLSLNSLRNEADIRFITLREFGDLSKFEERITNLINDLKLGQWTLLKQQSEYCVYDNNIFLDNGWLT